MKLAEFEVKLRVIGSSSPFNAMYTRVAYDPAKLTPVQISPVRTQLDSLFTLSCANLFHKFRFGGGFDTITVGILCENVSIAGPGPLYRLRFRAANLVSVTALQFEGGVELANGGIGLSGVTAQGALIGIGTPAVLDAVPALPAGALLLKVAPNPASGESRLDFGLTLESRGLLTVHDLQGRVVMQRELPAGARSATWNGREADGRDVSPGLYLATLRCGTRMGSARVIRVK